MDWYIAIILIVCAILGLWLCYAALIGALARFGMASLHGFIGLAAYLACWVFLVPIMLGLSVLIGVIRLMSDFSHSHPIDPFFDG